MTDFKQKFYDITKLIQKEFDRNLDIYGEKIQCRKGCSQCCSQIFRITKPDALIIARHINTLPDSKKNELIQKANHYKQGLPCPALGSEGECTIYEARPVICRRFGMPIYDYKNPEKIYACELNFKEGDEIVDDMLIPIQTEIGLKWDVLKDEFAASVPGIDSGDGTTIAKAIIGNF